MVRLRCQDCRATWTWDDIKENTVPADAEDREKASRGRAHTGKVVCPDCGNDGFDRLDE